VTKRAYVMEAYIPHGGTWMAYHLARILYLDFGYEVIVLTDTNGPDHGRFVYDPVFPTLPIAEIERVVRPQDLLVCNPSFSPYNFGLRLKCRKVMYIQDFKTFEILDGFFDHYVTVSPFVQKFINSVYKIKTRVIPPFIDVPEDTERVAWDDRPPLSLALNIKGDGDQQALLLQTLRRHIALRDPELESTLDWQQAWQASIQPREHAQLLGYLGAHRYLLSLSVAEGFGLVPLEAMAMGTVVTGFDGVGGRMYMSTSHNCAVSPYPRLEPLADHFVNAVRNERFARKLARNGQATARRFTYPVFRKAWKAEFSNILG